MRTRLLVAFIMSLAVLLAACADSSRVLTGVITVSNQEVNHLRALYFCQDELPGVCGEGSSVVEIVSEAELVRPAFIAKYEGATCTENWMGRGYADVSEGADVILRDGSGTVVAARGLGSGLYRIPRSMGSSYCEYTFEIEVASDVDFLQLSIGTRDGPIYSLEELEELEWHLELSVGQ